MNTAIRICNWLRRAGLIRDEPSADPAPSPLLDCLQGSLGVGELITDKGEKTRARTSETFKAKQGLVGQHGHFNVHAGVSIAVGQPEQRERLLRYCARAPLSLERLSLLEDGRIAYRVKHAYRGQTTVRVMTPMQFMARLAALIPPPRHPLIRFHGVFAPNSKWRSAIVPKPPSEAPSAAHTSCLHDPKSAHSARSEPAARATPSTSCSRHIVANAALKPATEFAALTPQFTARLDWATLLKRVYDIDALACPKCGGRLRFIEVIEDHGEARVALLTMGLAAAPPPLAKARAPDWDEN
jgi:hypothetical protein